MTAAVSGDDGAHPHPRASRPSSVRWLFALLITDIVLGLVSITTPLWSSPPADNDLVGLWYFAVAFVAVLTVIEVPLAFAIRSGRLWAWISQLVIATLNLPFAVWGVVRPGGFGTDDLALMGSSALRITIVVLLLVRPTRIFVGLGRRAGH